MTAFNEYGSLARVLLRPAREALGDPDRVAAEWRALNFTAPPDLGMAVAQYGAFASLLVRAGARVERLDEPGLTLDSIYARDASIVTPKGIVLCRMGKPARREEPAAQRRLFDALGMPIAGTIEAPGMIEGGDVVWFDAKTVAVGRGYRTNGDGIAQLRGLLGDGAEVVVVPLPHYRGPGDVFHLMSILSPVAEDLAVAYSPLMPVPFREWLLARGLRFVEVPDAEFESMGANVLAVAPRRVVMLAGNPVTQARLDAEGVEVWTYEGSEISVKGGGGPTCLTRPLARD
ncbi:MAG: dimethylarginine dimethylaminohydrolase family protein [Vicinamibacterales bacterium]